ncbi:hypothetical protein BV25DRAFT_730614 [Artomyces pyxidatus]|uniref:Uncharacterized protein n=1 Tax=Artomyces pyxidatus TaxID=48021 RepID=A0ACB8T0K7_9AGAM|nr:hypothetical protein BV25DRAFT_730614 [Artomyces pyxidatus]
MQGQQEATASSPFGVRLAHLSRAALSRAQPCSARASSVALVPQFTPPQPSSSRLTPSGAATSRTLSWSRIVSAVNLNSAAASALRRLSPIYEAERGRRTSRVAYHSSILRSRLSTVRIAIEAAFAQCSSSWSAPDPCFVLAGFCSTVDSSNFRPERLLSATEAELHQVIAMAVILMSDAGGVPRQLACGPHRGC